MDVVFENISSLIVFSILFLTVYAALLNVYFIHKNGFHVRVNCWFCNKNSKVLYQKRNSFVCPYCSQYNGFKKNGDYNRVIEAQHNKSLNNSQLICNERTRHSTLRLSTNGLCDSCNKNQQLRMLQLANYEPLNQKNYDKEIEHFERQLEKTYRLCKNCTKTVKSTIRRQNAWIFGNRLKNLKSPSKKEVFSHKVNNQTQESNEDGKFYRLNSVIRFILLILSVFNLFILCDFHRFIPKHLLPEVSLPSNVIFSNAYSNIYKSSIRKFGHLKFVKSLPKTLNVQQSNILFISVTAITIEFIFTFIERNCTFFGKFSKLLSWLILGLISTIHFKPDISVYINTLEIFCSFWLVYSYFSSCVNFRGNQPRKFTLKRLRKTYENKEYSDNEESSSDSLNDSGATYRTAVTKSSPITASSLNNSVNRSFESVRSTKTAPLLNSTFTHSNEYAARNIELNKHFDDLNLGAFEPKRPMSCLSYPSPSSPNPFLNQFSRPASSNSMFNYGMNYNNPVGSFPRQAPQNYLFKLQNSPVNSTFGHMGNASFTDNQTPYTHQPQNLSPRSDRSEHMSVQSLPYTFASNKSNNLAFNGQNHHSSRFALQHNNGYTTLSPRNISSGLSHNSTVTARSPTYSVRSRNDQNSSSFVKNNRAQLNNSFRSLSPLITIERPTRALLSPSKLSHITSFHSDAKENENLSLSFHAENAPRSNIWSSMNAPHMHQRFVVNSLSEMPPNSPLFGNLVSGNTENLLSHSRSSSSSSGFISNGDFSKVQTRSLPNSRDHSPDRNSLLSEPAYHFKVD